MQAPKSWRMRIAAAIGILITGLAVACGVGSAACLLTAIPLAGWIIVLSRA